MTRLTGSGLYVLFLSASASSANECGYPFGFLDGLEGDAVNPGAPFVGTDKVIGMTEDVGPIYLVIQGVEAAGRFLLGLAVELPL